tara:strand:+ start:345 stop:1142 length:798 start_codon:yes stop_codon:yes gene_type:complete
MFGLGVNKLGSIRTAPFSPQALFGTGDSGVWLDVSDVSSLFQNSDGTVAAVVGQPVGYVTDKSGNGNHAIQATSTKAPVLRQSGDLYYLEFDGADDGLQIPTLTLTATDKVTHFTGHRKIGTGNSVLLEHSANAVTTNGTFSVSAPQNDTNKYLVAATGTVRSSNNVNAEEYNEPFTGVLTVTADIAGDLLLGRINGTEVFSDTGDMGTGNFSAAEPLNIGARNSGAGLQFEGYVYQLIVVGRIASSNEILETERYVARKTGVNL